MNYGQQSSGFDRRQQTWSRIEHGTNGELQTTCRLRPPTQARCDQNYGSKSLHIVLLKASAFGFHNPQMSIGSGVRSSNQSKILTGRFHRLVVKSVFWQRNVSNLNFPMWLWCLLPFSVWTDSTVRRKLITNEPHWADNYRPHCSSHLEREELHGDTFCGKKIEKLARLWQWQEKKSNRVQNACTPSWSFQMQETSLVSFASVNRTRVQLQLPRLCAFFIDEFYWICMHGLYVLEEQIMRLKAWKHISFCSRVQVLLVSLTSTAASWSWCAHRFYWHILRKSIVSLRDPQAMRVDDIV